MGLDDRKLKILEAIITDYIKLGEPISSRNIAKNHNLGISSATIRNEMSDLEEIGLIIQPHTSSGRIPSDKGYRLYVDTIMGDRELTKEEAIFLQNVVSNNISHMDYLMEQTARALSMLTSYATIVTRPKGAYDCIESVHLLPFDDKNIIAVFITEHKKTKSCTIPVHKALFNDELEYISSRINDLINIYDIEELKFFLRKDTSDIFYPYNEIFKNIFNEILYLVEQEDIKIYTSGINNMLNFKEFSDIEKAKPIFKTFEQKDILIDILDATSINNNSIQILIGDENSIDQFKNCSIVKTEYKINGAIGTIGILAPTRMDYAKAVSVLNELLKNINDIIKNISS